ncbi:similar to Saccharomyces cerevisiae YPR018W RLF2 Largest subunit (p90) of the Chromatin Assembly Complex (CAF-1) with Cac2p and Msi1p that assembles newly synthesized histones onto recently replicated DNA [Maudiozyma barnettii]|uniref:Chromatin assembly factor 1 subunit A n=1 Tax=Maudiozyma barnettii TaxID=61262 RepID=A0A8H2VBW8_9SACH|nr:Rlf2p [Kazachstania barnettii]CAB4252437.1 similar to Saccharomyces cerevisiae YPR018W RLF2 Largest subunit (p90) of the Chromatin Assembly Complex (CAF-1) with Cac2p and Msi1p that assembles newly synthesized histones onto recently replicated DNA [Kazachstania barnettii]CAD1779172.1 similar to Saccharomyces cerevisiae YPR018W RLF2 Largest subunit (p90) of the Chromatin Assembly Complex (CAF-1) with Cac2p and Msi1p that assembles newly synthesized histones onto recently replicated DNA [Kazachs
MSEDIKIGKKGSILSFFKNTKKDTSKNKVANKETPISVDITNSSDVIDLDDLDKDDNDKKNELTNEVVTTSIDRETNTVSVPESNNSETKQLSDKKEPTVDSIDPSDDVPELSVDNTVVTKEVNEDDENSKANKDNTEKEDTKQIEKKKKAEEKLIVKKQKEEERLKFKQEREQERLRLKEQKEEEKRKREEEKQKLKEQREEEKRKREEAKLKLKLERDLERAKKEEEKRKKEEQKKKEEEAKEKSQSRIANFFKKVSDKNKPETSKSDYESSFLPFYTRDGVIMPITSITSKDEIKDKMNAIDDMLNQPITENNINKQKLWLSSRQTSRNKGISYKAVTLLQQMTAKDKSDEELQALLSLVPQKYIKFYENVRPPYIGTYSKDTKLPIDNPFSTEGTNYNYSYDSDLEWVNEEEDADGAGIDNLESGDEEDDEDDDEEEGSENEFDGFLDKEESGNSGNNNKKFIGPLIPTVLLRVNIESMDGDDKQYFNLTSAESLLADMTLPIEPHEKIRNATQSRVSANTSPSKRLADALDNNPNNNGSLESPEKKKAKLLITDPKDLLKLFDEIQDSTFSLGTVTEISQKSLPNYNKQTIKNTVKEYAIRGSGKGDSPRKWQIKDITHWEQLRSSV